MIGRIRLLALALACLAIPHTAFATYDLKWRWTTSSKVADTYPYTTWYAADSTQLNYQPPPTSLSDGDTIWIGFENAHNPALKKYLRVDLLIPGISMSVSMTGYKTADVSQPVTVRQLQSSGSPTGDTLFTEWMLEPQPMWERLAIVVDEDVDSLQWNITALSDCVLPDWQPPNLWLNNMNFGVPGAMDTDPLITEVWVFPFEGSVDLSAPDFFAPPSSGSWSSTFVYTDPDGNPRPGGGVRFASSGPGLTVSDAVTVRISLVGAALRRAHVYSYDANTSTYRRNLIRFGIAVPGLAPWGLLVAGLATLAAGAIRGRRRAA